MSFFWHRAKKRTAFKQASFDYIPQVLLVTGGMDGYNGNYLSSTEVIV